MGQEVTEAVDAELAQFTTVTSSSLLVANGAGQVPDRDGRSMIEGSESVTALYESLFRLADLIDLGLDLNLDLVMNIDMPAWLIRLSSKPGS
jgi:hypothetical protein